MRHISIAEEVLKALRESGRSPEDVHWVRYIGRRMSWDDFAEKTKGMLVDRYGPEIDHDLKVVGVDWWCEWTIIDCNCGPIRFLSVREMPNEE